MMEEQVSREFPSTPAGRTSSAEPLVADKPQIKPQRRGKTRARIVQIVSVLVLVVVLVFLWRFLGDKSSQRTPGAGGRNEVVPVEMAAVTQRDVPTVLKAIGNVEQLSTISVRSQVEGNLQSVAFVPGQEVEKGALLFQIDPRPLQSALNDTEANLLKVIAKRDANLLEAGVIAREQYHNDEAKLKADEATVRADQSAAANLQAAQKAEQAAVENARVQLSYTTIRAPIAGKTGNLAVTAGNLVQPNATTSMVTITQSAPIYVTFSIPERELMRIRQNSGASGLTAEVEIPGDESNHVLGKLSLVDNTVDVATGTVRLKATFQNDDRRLYPGQFVNVVLTLGTQNQAIVVPSQAVQIGQDKSFVYVVKADMTVEMRTVKTGTTIENMTVIDDGLKPGEQVVTDGQLRLVPGAKVQTRGQGGGQGRQGGQGEGQGGNPGAQGYQGERRRGGG